jgi:ketosteroid isomerase-like protein
MKESTPFELTTEAGWQPMVFAEAFNSGDPDLVEEVYEDRSILIPTPGNPVAGAQRREANRALQALGRPIEVRPRHVYGVDDIALLIADWVIAGRDGAEEIQGTAADVARRGADGKWRYVIDNPFGVAASRL